MLKNVFWNVGQNDDFYSLFGVIFEILLSTSKLSKIRFFTSYTIKS